MSFETDQLLPEPRLPADAALSTFIRMRRGFFMLSIASEVRELLSATASTCCSRALTPTPWLRSTLLSRSDSSFQ